MTTKVTIVNHGPGLVTIKARIGDGTLPEPLEVIAPGKSADRYIYKECSLIVEEKE